MVYFKSHEKHNDLQSLVPFTTQVLPVIEDEGYDLIGTLKVGTVTIFSHRAKGALTDTFHNAERLAKLKGQLRTLIQYINDTVINAAEEGIPMTVIDVADWEEDIF